jgi:CoA:oxalate CoA-transferase
MKIAPETKDLSMVEGPLTNVTILDFSRVLAGPFATAMLSDVGADVIKVESPAGDDYRHVGPFVAGRSALFDFVNRGKRSIVLNLNDQADRETAWRLARTADVVVENFRPGVADKLGIGYEQLSAVKPDLIYLSISGFGNVSPFRERAAYDIIIQAESGMMSITGDPDGAPTLVGDSIADVTSGLYGAWAISTALWQRERTGSGCRIDLAMFDTLLSLMPTAACSYLATGEIPVRVGNRHALSAPFGAYRSADSHVVIAILNEKLFREFAKVIGKPELANDRRFESDAARCENEPALRELIEQWTFSHATGEIIQILSRSGIPAAVINSVAAAIDNEHTNMRSLFRSGALTRLPEQPAHFSGMQRGQSVRAPHLGEHTQEILSSIGQPRQ